MQNKFEFSHLLYSTYVVLKKDCVFYDEESNEVIDPDGQYDPHNIYRGQLGFVVRSLNNGSTKSYIVGFKDINADSGDLNEGYLQELELFMDEIIPLILPIPAKGKHRELKEVEFFKKCYMQEMYVPTKLPQDKKIIEFPQGENVYFEFVSCPDTEISYFKNNKTSTQFHTGSLVTFQDVCYFKHNHAMCIYPGQIGVIIGKTERPEHEENHYVEVLVAVYSLKEWYGYSPCRPIPISDILAERRGCVIEINKYNLVPIFFEKLTLHPDELYSYRKFQELKEKIPNLTEEKYKAELMEINIPEEEIIKRVKLFKTVQNTLKQIKDKQIKDK